MQGISGTHKFRELDAADRFARQKLIDMASQQAIEAETSCKTITVETKDSAPVSATGKTIFFKKSHIRQPERTTGPGDKKRNIVMI